MSSDSDIDQEDLEILLDALEDTEHEKIQKILGDINQLTVESFQTRKQINSKAVQNSLKFPEDRKIEIKNRVIKTLEQAKIEIKNTVHEHLKQVLQDQMTSSPH
jgi:hypothetical protein